MKISEKRTFFGGKRLRRLEAFASVNLQAITAENESNDRRENFYRDEEAKNTQRS